MHMRVIHSPRHFTAIAYNVRFFCAGLIHGLTAIAYLETRPSPEALLCITYPRDFCNSDAAWMTEIDKHIVPAATYSAEFADSGIIMFVRGRHALVELAIGSEDARELSAARLFSYPHHWVLEYNLDEWRCLGMRILDHGYVLCYDNYGVYINLEDNEWTTRVVEWEAPARRVAWHPPHMILSSQSQPDVLEIRDMDTGDLLQIIHYPLDINDPGPVLLEGGVEKFAFLRAIAPHRHSDIFWLMKREFSR